MKSAQRVTIQRGLRTTMADGVELSCDLYRPDSRTAMPTLLRCTPCDRGEDAGGAALHIGRLTELGYNVVVQAVCGRNGSDGRFTPFLCEATNGVETIRWITEQPWSDGSVDMFSRAYDGLAQWHAAGSTEIELPTLAPDVTATDLYRSWGYPGDAFQLGFLLRWALCDLLVTKGIGVAELLGDIERVYHEPSTAFQLSDPVTTYVRAWIEHPLLDQYWQAQIPTSFDSGTLIITIRIPTPELVLPKTPNRSRRSTRYYTNTTTCPDLSSRYCRKGQAMNILGINGWPGASHDAAACLLIDGTIAACTEEERFIRRKHAYGVSPHNAVASCLHQAGLRFEDIDVIAHGWDMPELLARRNVTWPGTDAEVIEFLFPSKFFPRTRDPRLVFINHHLAHAASAYYLSGHGRTSILVLDGQGENESTTLATGIDGKIKPVRSVSPSWSLGYFYDAVCQYSGLGAATAGKLMGLAPHGRVREEGIAGFRHTGNGYELDIIPEELISVGRTDEEQDTVTRWLEHLAQVLPDPPNTGTTPHYDPLRSRLRTRPPRDPFEYRDLAATAQNVLERCVIAMAKDLLSSTGERFLTLAGGVGFNATLNGKLARLPEVEDLFVQPLAGDQGVALGAAVHVAVETGETVAPMTGTIAWGPSYSPDDIRTVLDRSGVAYTQSDDITADTAQLLERGAVVGWYQGRSEVGPRALGQRSMLALPQPESNRDRINVTIKDRELWRPFAPSLHEEAAQELLGLTEPLPYMIVTTPVPEEYVASLAAVIHVDGTTRPQTVSRQMNPLYHDLLTEVQRRTGIPVVLNTSFNGRDEPIVGSPSDALATFYGCPMDALAIGPFLIRKGMAS